MSQETAKVKYKIRHVTDYNHLGEAKLDNASHEYVVAVEKLKEIEAIMKEEAEKGWTLMLRNSIGDWGFELFFEHENKKPKKRPSLAVKPK